MARKALVVCNLNRTRSKYIAKRLQQYCDGHDIDAEVYSAGIAAPMLDGYTQVTKEMVDDADAIFTMDYHTTNELMKKYIMNDRKGLLSRATERRNMGKLHNLRIPDIFIPEEADPGVLTRTRADEMRDAYLSGLDDMESSVYVERMSRADIERAVFGTVPEEQKNILVPSDVLKKTIDFRIERIAEVLRD